MLRIIVIPPIASEYITSSGFTTIADNSSFNIRSNTYCNILLEVFYSVHSIQQHHQFRSSLKVYSQEGGYVKAGESGNFTYGISWDTLMLNERRQALGYNGRIHGTATTPDGNSYVFISFGAPDNGSCKCIQF